MHLRVPAQAALAVAVLVFVSAAPGNAAGPQAPGPAKNLATATPSPQPGSLVPSGTSLLQRAHERLATLPVRVVYRAAAQGGVPSSRQDVVVNGSVDRSLAARVPSYCAAHRLQIERVAGNVTPGGTLTVTGVCFGTSGTGVRLEGKFPGGGIDLQVRSWSDESVVAIVPEVKGVLDGPVTLRLSAPQFAVSSDRFASVAIRSAPVALTFIAARARIAVNGTALTNLSCVTDGDRSDDGCGYCAWQFSAEPAGCPTGYHVRKSGPASGIDAWAVRLPPTWRIEEISAPENAELVTDPSISASSATFRVRWSTVTVPGYGGAPPTQDGSYTFKVVASGPDGTFS